MIIKKTSSFLSICLAFLLVSGCGMFGTNSQVPTIPEPPQKVSQNDARLVNANRNIGNVDSTKRSENIRKELEDEKEKEENEPRIQEERNANGGEVEEIKVNNKNLPPYYIYPAHQQNWNVNPLPDQSIATPNWQINW